MTPQCPCPTQHPHCCPLPTPSSTCCSASGASLSHSCQLRTRWSPRLPHIAPIHGFPYLPGPLRTHPPGPNPCLPMRDHNLSVPILSGAAHLHIHSTFASLLNPYPFCSVHKELASTPPHCLSGAPGAGSIPSSLCAERSGAPWSLQCQTLCPLALHLRSVSWPFRHFATHLALAQLSCQDTVFLSLSVA